MLNLVGPTTEHKLLDLRKKGNESETISGGLCHFTLQDSVCLCIPNVSFVSFRYPGVCLVTSQYYPEAVIHVCDCLYYSLVLYSNHVWLFHLNGSGVQVCIYNFSLRQRRDLNTVQYKMKMKFYHAIQCLSSNNTWSAPSPLMMSKLKWM